VVCAAAQPRLGLQGALQQGRLPCGGSATRASNGPPRKAVALLEAQPPGPELIAAYAELAGCLFLRGALEESLAPAELALRLAIEFDLAEPARALGFRGVSRSFLRDRQGIEDMRRALQLALEQGEGRTAAVLHNNLATSTSMYDGPQAALAVSQEGIDFSNRRSITEIAVGLAAETVPSS